MCRRREILDVAIRGCLAVALYLAFPPFSDIHRLWERANGLNPSWPAGSFEYPPLAALYFEPLASLPSSRWAVAVSGLVMVLAAIAITWVLLSISKTSPVDVDTRMWVASPALLLFLPINWDVLVVLISLLGVVSLYQSREALSGVCSGLGTALKIFPGALVLPVLPLIDGWRRRTWFLAAGFLVLGLSYVGYIWLEPDRWRFHLEFASARTDIESTIWGILDFIVRAFDVELSIGAVNLLSTVSVGSALVFLTVWVARTKPTFAEVAVLALTALLVLNKIFKPQYVLWVLPFYAWLSVSRWKARVVEAAAIMAFVVVYFDVPSWINLIETGIRVTFLVGLAVDVIRARAARSSTPIS